MPTAASDSADGSAATGRGCRDGRMVTDIGSDEISFLIETQSFDERDACDRRAIGCAIARAVTRN